MKKKKSKPFLSAETRQAIDERKETSDKINSTRSERIKGRLRVEYTLKDREVKRRARQDRRKWLEEVALNAHKSAENGGWRMVNEWRTPLYTHFIDLKKSVSLYPPRKAYGR